MLDSPKALLLDSANWFPAAQKRRGNVAMIGVDAEN
jgi:hypothetical protein